VDYLIGIFIIVAYVALQGWILPRMGVPT